MWRCIIQRDVGGKDIRQGEPDDYWKFVFRSTPRSEPYVKFRVIATVEISYELRKLVSLEGFWVAI